MVLAAKVFEVREQTDLDSIATKLKGYNTKEQFEQEGQRIELLTEIRDLTMTVNTLEGTFSQDQVLTVLHHGKVSYIPKTLEAHFIFTQQDTKTMLIVLEKKQAANNIANQLSKTLFITAGQIVEARIPPENLQRFHEENFDDTKVIFFDDVDVPNVAKLSLYGSALGNTTLYTDYLSHGKIWYTVIKSKKYGYIVGITRNTVVTVFSRVEKPDFINYIANEILPLTK